MAPASASRALSRAPAPGGCSLRIPKVSPRDPSAVGAGAVPAAGQVIARPLQGPDEAGVLAQLDSGNANVAVGGLEGCGLDRRVDVVEELRPDLHHAAPQHQHLGVKDVQQAAEAPAEEETGL